MSALGHVPREVAQARPLLGLVGKDGTPIAARVTHALGGPPKGVLVHVNGTAAGAGFTDLMARELAPFGITTYELGSRSALQAGGTFAKTSPDLHTDDLRRLVDVVRASHPGTPAAVAGTSLGAAVAMYFNTNGRNAGKLPIVAMAPVFLEQFLPFSAKAKLARGVVLPSTADALLPTPMAVNRVMSTNPASLYNTTDLSRLRVPASTFIDNAKMAIGSLLKGRKSAGHVTVVMPGAEQVGVNWATKLASPFIGGKAGRTVVEIPGAPHELSQEAHNPRLVQLLADAAMNGRPL